MQPPFLWFWIVMCLSFLLIQTRTSSCSSPIKFKYQILAKNQRNMWLRSTWWDRVIVWSKIILRVQMVLEMGMEWKSILREKWMIKKTDISLMSFSSHPLWGQHAFWTGIKSFLTVGYIGKLISKRKSFFVCLFVFYFVLSLFCFLNQIVTNQCKIPDRQEVLRPRYNFI